MNPDDLPPILPKKRIFKPIPPRRKIVPKKEPVVDDGRAAGLQILKSYNESSKNRKPDAPNDSSSAVDYREVTASAEQYGTVTTGNFGNSNSHVSESSDRKQKALCLPAPDISTQDIVSSSSDAGGAKKIGKEKDYVEPWDYSRNYPTTLPLRKPGLGNPEILNELEFGENRYLQPDESSKHDATKLELQVEYENHKLFLVQLPPKLPIPIRLYGRERPDTDGSSKPPASGQSSSSRPKNKASASSPVIDQAKRYCDERFSGGAIGKMLVYKNGNVKLKIGETMFEVAPGIQSENMAQDIVAVNKMEKNFCEIGEIERKMVVKADIDFLLASRRNLQ